MTTEIDTVAIDPTTGLPELPEGHFWQVRRKKEYRYGFDYFSGFEVVWMIPDPDGVKTVRKRKHWYSLFESDVEVPDTRPVAKVNMPIKTTIQGEEIEALELRKPEILEVAIRAFKKVKAKEETEHLLGDYPPKTLNGEN